MSDSYPTKGGTLTTGDCYAKMIYHIGEAQSLAAMISHLRRAQGEDEHTLLEAKGWLGVSEQLRNMQILLNRFATQGFLMN